VTGTTVALYPQLIHLYFETRKLNRVMVSYTIKGGNMQSKQALQSTQKNSPSSPLFVEAGKLFEEMKDFSQSVARRAYDFFESRGRELGHELEDWFRAESELLRPVPAEITENNERITVSAEVPGFSANEIKVSVEPEYLVISGRSEQKTEEKAEQMVYSDRRSRQFCRSLELPAQVDPATATATLKDGILELTLAKAAVSKAVNVEVKTV
jgi:HSP20 family protein